MRLLVAAVGRLGRGPETAGIDKLTARIDALSRVTRLGPITPTMLEDLFVDFVKKISSRGALTGNFDSTERLLANAAERLARSVELGHSLALV